MKHAWIGIVVLVLVSFGCHPGTDAKRGVLAARVDASYTLRELQEMHPDPFEAGDGVNKAVIHLYTIEQLLIPAEAYYRGKDPKDLSGTFEPNPAWREKGLRP